MRESRKNTGAFDTETAKRFREIADMDKKSNSRSFHLVSEINADARFVPKCKVEQSGETVVSSETSCEDALDQFEDMIRSDM